MRAGFGIFYDLGAGIITQAAAGFPYYRQRNILTQGFWPLDPSNAMPPPFSLKPPIPSIYGAVDGFRLPLTYQWNIGLNQSIGRSNALSISYVAAAGRHLLRQDFYVNPNADVTYAYLLAQHRLLRLRYSSSPVPAPPGQGTASAGLVYLGPFHR